MRDKPLFYLFFFIFPLYACQEETKSQSIPGSFVSVYLHQADSLLNIRSYDAATELYHMALAKNSHSAGAWAGLGQVAQHQGLDDKAYQHFQMALDIDSLYVPALTGQAALAFRRSQYVQARDAYLKILRVGQYTPKIYYKLGLAYIRLTAYEEATQALQNAVHLDSSYALAWYTLGQVYMERLGRQHDALEAMRRAVREWPEWPLGYRGLGMALLKRHEYQGASKAFQQLIVLDSLDAEGYFGLGQVYEQEGDIEGALSHFRFAVDRDPVHAKAHFRLGQLYRRQGNMEKAQDHLAYFEKLRPHVTQINRLRSQLIDDPDNAGLLYRLGTFYNRLELYPQAIRIFRRALDSHGDHAPSYNNLGNAYLNLGRPKLAITMFKTAVNVDTSYVLAYNNLGYIWLHEGELIKAEKAYQRALLCAPDNTQAVYGLGMVYREQGKVTAASRMLEKYQRLEEDK